MTLHNVPFKPPYTNTFRSIPLDFSSGTGVATANLNIPFAVDEIVFRGVMATFPPTPIQTNFTIYHCPSLTDCNEGPIAFSHYSSVVDTAQTSSGTILSYVFLTPKIINGQYSFYETNVSSISVAVSTGCVIFAEF